MIICKEQYMLYVWNFQCYILKVYIVELMKMLTNLFPCIYRMKLEFIDSAVNYPWVEHSSGTIPMPTWITYVFDQQSILSDELGEKNRRHHKEIVLSTCIYLHFITIIYKKSIHSAFLFSNCHVIIDNKLQSIEAGPS